MVDLTINGIIEIAMQLGVSLVIAIVIICPVVVLYFAVKRWLIYKKAPIDDLKQQISYMKGGSDGIITKEEYKKADNDFLRRYSERKYINGTGKSSTSIDKRRIIGRQEDIIRGTEETINKTRLPTSFDSNITGEESDRTRQDTGIKRNWAKFN